jgi:hypothetical protein
MCAAPRISPAGDAPSRARPESSVPHLQEKDAHARQRGHPFDLGYALSLGAHEFDHRFKHEDLRKRAEECERHGRRRSANGNADSGVKNERPLRNRRRRTARARIRAPGRRRRADAGILALTYAVTAVDRGTSLRGPPIGRMSHSRLGVARAIRYLTTAGARRVLLGSADSLLEAARDCRFDLTSPSSYGRGSSR